MVPFAAALVLTFLLTGLAVPVLRRALFMDVPNHRSSHSQPVPRGGGGAFVISLLAVGLVSVDLTSAVLALLATTIALAAVGLVDDIRSLPSSLRLLAQVVAAVVLSLVVLSQGSLSWWWLPVLIVAIAGYVNAYNFMDGVNGISGLTALVVGLWWVWVGLDQDRQGLTTLGWVLAGSAAGFLPWNAPRAKVFLGDVGSYGIGVFISGLSAWALSSGVPWHWALAPLVIYGADTGWVLIKRFRAGAPLAEAHREHVYQRLTDQGWPHIGSAAFCAAAGALVCAAAGLSGQSLVWWCALIALVIVAGYLSSPRFVERTKQAS